LGDVSSWSNLASNNAYLGFYNTDGLTYTSSGGALSSNIADSINIDWRNSSLSESEVDNILVDLNASGATNGTLYITGNTAPSATGTAAKTNMVDNKSWTIDTD